MFDGKQYKILQVSCHNFDKWFQRHFMENSKWTSFSFEILFFFQQFWVLFSVSIQGRIKDENHYNLEWIFAHLVPMFNHFDCSNSMRINFQWIRAFDTSYCGCAAVIYGEWYFSCEKACNIPTTKKSHWIDIGSVS